MVTDASQIESAVNEMMARRGQTRNVMEGIEFPHKDNLLLHNHVRFHHPDGTHSDIAGPTYNPKRPTPYLKRFLEHWLSKPGPKGGRWFYLERQAPAPEANIRCFVEGCPRAGGFKNNLHLYQHVMAKHSQESQMYADVLEEMKRQTQAQLDPEVVRQLGIGPKAEAEPTPETFHCRVEGCSRFFDTEPSRNGHEYSCKKKEK